MPMLDSETLLQIFIVVVIVNIVIVEVAVFLVWRRRPTAATPMVTLGPETSAATSSTAQPAPRTAAPEPAAPETAARETLAAETPSDDGSASDRSSGTDDDLTLLVDPETGLETAFVWNDSLRYEEARRARYGHAATVVVLELFGLDRLAERLGSTVANRLIVPVAATLVRSSRASDRVARVGPARFHVLMPETDEVSAINYVERVRESLDMWLEAGAVAIRANIGWASPPTGGTLADAVRLADERMHADRHPRPRTRVGYRPRVSVGSSPD
jgi:diguanylate cyclase (GGDEF)-like protein